MSESLFEELIRYTGIEEADYAALRAFHPKAAPHLAGVAESFYARLRTHEGAQRVFSGPDQIERLKKSLREWLHLLLTGPWGDAYYEQRLRIGQVHVRVGLSQRYMFGAMNHIRHMLHDLADNSGVAGRAATALHRALDKLLDLELAIMLESYRDAYMRAQHTELTGRAQRAERLASLGGMAAGLAHEIKNPLNAAHLQLALIQRRLNKGPVEPQAISAVTDLVSGELRRVGALVEQFLEFARPKPLVKHAADIRSAAETIVNLMAPEAEAAGVALVLNPGPSVNAVVDEERLKQVLLNLVRNAVDATDPGGKVEVTVDVEGDFARLTVADNGKGFDPSHPVFEPFFTTKSQGTGLGLAIVQRIVLEHGGDITAESQPGRTIFQAAFPRS